MNPANPIYEPDSPQYITVMRWMTGKAEQTPVVRYRLFAPVVPALAALVGPIVGEHGSWLILNLLFLIGTVLLCFRLILRLGYPPSTAVAGAVMLSTAMPVLAWSATVLVDMASWFAAAMLVNLAWRKQRNAVADTLLAAFACALAVLVKPTLAAVVAFFFLHEWLVRGNLRRAMAIGATAMTLVCAYYLLMRLGPADFLYAGRPRHRHMLLLLSSQALAFNALIPLSAATLVSRRARQRIPKKLLLSLGILLACTLMEFAFFVHATRLAFISWPFWVVLSGILAGEFCDTRIKRALLLCGVILSSFLSAWIYANDTVLEIAKSIVGMSW